jgi:predicted nucleic acid-binding protein
MNELTWVFIGLGILGILGLILALKDKGLKTMKKTGV